MGALGTSSRPTSTGLEGPCPPSGTSLHRYALGALGTSSRPTSTGSEGPCPPSGTSLHRYALGALGTSSRPTSTGPEGPCPPSGTSLHRYALGALGTSSRPTSTGLEGPCPPSGTSLPSNTPVVRAWPTLKCSRGACLSLLGCPCLMDLDLDPWLPVAKSHVTGVAVPPLFLPPLGVMLTYLCIPWASGWHVAAPGSTDLLPFSRPIRSRPLYQQICWLLWRSWRLKEALLPRLRHNEA
jgi:phosphatidylethanolamine-binding protein (PEBP) family uncharacterized protein